MEFGETAPLRSSSGTGAASAAPPPSASPRPPSPTGSVMSATSSMRVANASRRRTSRGTDRPPSPALSTTSRFDAPDVTFEEAMAYVSKPHTSWDSALKEMARRETRAERGMSDTESNASSVSAYSMASTAKSVASSVTSRKGALAGLPRPNPSPPPAPDFAVGGTSIGGSSFVFKQPKSAITGGGGGSPLGPRQAGGAGGPGPSPPTTAAAPFAVGPAGGATGIRRSLATKAPSSAPTEKGKRTDVPSFGVSGKPVASGFEGGAVATQSPLQVGPSVASAFVPRLAPRKR